MTTLRTILSQAKQRLRDASIQTYAIDAELLMIYSLNYQGREELLLQLSNDTSLTSIQQIVFEENVQRRIAREPISQILGTKHFYLSKFKVTSHVLTPRPETELMIDSILQTFPDRSYPYDFLDLGTGSGCIAITLAMLYPQASVTGLDISVEALCTARENAKSNNVHVRFLESNWCDQLEKDEVYDAILSNPPYIPYKDWVGLEADVKEYEPSIALTDFEDGLTHYQTIAKQTYDFLKPGGFLLFEIGIEQASAVCDITTSFGYELYQKHLDLNNIERCLIFQKKS
ncbi:peptide chain release factor N(5)-glutamine methyltransferase [Rickettsiales endosymbiont of Peranema trichophorum]|uniref:peptide chain release factor N(5)-glutamine methyltransferase n=1 Tax=Rickettsiales endosymbiont of Peranema trichophorum TaxID=2486577 RepID=UPI0013EE8F9D|nr:peptide chain release factor N(5)-glutamine methyltransferase [Rickettsiales endosymbiont of Peranema trichophorum]